MNLNASKWLLLALSLPLTLSFGALSKRLDRVVRVSVDATDIQHRIFKVNSHIPVEPGSFNLWLPEWEPGTHGPTSPVGSLAGLTIFANGKRVEFKRDLVNPHAFHLQVPKGVDEIEVTHQVISPANPGADRVVMASTMLNLQWIRMLLYPAGFNAKDLTYEATLTIPSGWKAFSALDVESESNGVIKYKKIDFANLLDSPVFAGKYYKTVDLDPGAKIPVRLNIVADDPRFLDIKDEHLKAHQDLVKQAYKLYNSQHYDHYDFLLSVSKQMSGIGLEHHRSSENGVDTAYFTEWDAKTNGSSLLPHEYTHSWNGKFRRPADLSTPHFNTPMKDTLLWVYEGLTDYYGEVLAARSGIRNLDGAREAWAQDVATYRENRPGFAWRTLQDTTNDPIIDYRAPKPYTSWQLRADYYAGSAMMWLEADITIRKLSNGTKSLDDFANAFYSVDNGSWGTPKTYTFEDVVRTLNNVVAHDWRNFLRSRLDGHESLSKGFEDSGWRLVFKETPTATQKAKLGKDKVGADLTYSLGMVVDGEGKITQVRWDSPAFRAGVGTGMTLMAVNDRQFDKDYLSDAVTAAKSSGKPIELLVKDFDVYRRIKVEYKEGLRYPAIERIEGTTDYLTAIFSPK